MCVMVNVCKRCAVDNNLYSCGAIKYLTNLKTTT